MEKVTLDLNGLAGGKVELASFQEQVNRLDLGPYRGKHVQLKGCAPTWAHLLVAGKLFGVAAAVDFLLDDGGGGNTVSVYKNERLKTG